VRRLGPATSHRRDTRPCADIGRHRGALRFAAYRADKAQLTHQPRCHDIVRRTLHLRRFHAYQLAHGIRTTTVPSFAFRAKCEFILPLVFK
jgi:hypothetical protein